MHRPTKEDAEEAIVRWKIICEYLTDMIEFSYQNEDWEQTIDWMWDFPHKVDNMCKFYQTDYFNKLKR